jgi:hypothetical protein
VVLDVRGRPIVYRPPTIEAAAEIFVNPIEVKLGSGSPSVDVRYTLDGSEPSASSPRYASPLRVGDTVVIKARCFEGERAVSSITETRFIKVAPRKATAIQPQRGLVCEVFEGDWEKLPSFDGLAPVARAVVSALTLETGRREHVGRRYRGYLSVPRDDVYRFALTSDDGARLLIDDRIVVNNDGLHSAEERTGTAALAAGWHPITVQYFNRTGGAELKLACGPAAGPLEDVAGERFAHTGNP